MHFRGAAVIVLFGQLLLARAGMAQPACPLIDVHQHALPLNVYSPKPIGPNNPLRIPCVNDRLPCDNPPSRFSTDEAVLKGTLEYMQRYNIVRAYVSANDPKQLRMWTEAAPGRFVAGPFWNKMETAPTIEALRQAFKRKEYGLLGEIGTQYFGLAPNNKTLDPYFTLAEELDMPVLIHTGGIGARLPSFRVSAGEPLLLEDVLTRHPKLRLYVENAGYPFTDQMIAMLYQYPQLHADLSTVTWLIPREAFHDHVRRLVRAGFINRLMFGSDQMAWPETIGMAVDAIESADFLSPDQKCDIFFNNAVRFFRLDADALKKSSWPR
jgi:predicted TIM-barrel fold metal-dependent hydrolase